MDSRRVGALTEGYLRGWLTFEAKLGTSSLREELIIARIERETAADILGQRILIDAALLAPRLNKELIQAFDSSFAEYKALKLPYTRVPDKLAIDAAPTAPSSSLSDWKELLDKLNQSK